MATRSQSELRDRLFDDFDRTDSSPCGHTEREFAYLNRTSDQAFSRVREEMERWFGQMPPDQRAGLAARARGNDHEWASVFWELYLHNLLRRAGFTVEVEPDLPGVTTHVDFLAKRGDLLLAVEATTVLGPGNDGATRQRRDRLRAALDSLRSPNFTMSMYVNRDGHSDFAMGRHRGGIERWLASLDPVADAARTFRILSDGWELEIVSHPLAQEDRNKARSPVSVFGSGEASLIDDVTPLSKRLRKKGSHYGDLTVPFVPAVLMLGHFADERDVMSALFGTSAIQYTQRIRKEDPPPWARWVRRDDGYFLRSTGPVHPGVSGIVVAQGLRPWNIADVSPVLWHHPAPDRPVGDVLPLPSVSVQLPTGNPWRQHAEVPIHEAVGIEARWPGFAAQHERTA